MQTNKKAKLKTTIPLAALMREAQLMFAWCRPDIGLLCASGLDRAVIDNLPALCDRTEKLYVRYKTEQKTIPLNYVALAREFGNGYTLRAAIAEKVRVALRLNGNGKKLPSYHHRRAFQIIIKDLFDLAALHRAFKPGRNHTGDNGRLADEAETMAGMLEKKLVHYKMELIAKDTLYDEFIKMYHTLSRDLQKIRFIALKIFPIGSPRRSGYRRIYNRKNSSLQAKKSVTKNKSNAS
jgi:hypothetical protein